MASTKALVREQKLADIILYAARNLILENESVVLGLIIILTLVVRAIVLALGFVSVPSGPPGRCAQGLGASARTTLLFRASRHQSDLQLSAMKL
jgi:hypothetical protein